MSDPKDPIDPDIKNYLDEDYDRSQKEIKKCQKVFRDLIRSLVDFPSEVEVQTVCGDHVVIFEVIVAQDDIRRVIGRKGRIADALREILLSLGAKAGKRFVLEIVEPNRKK